MGNSLSGSVANLLFRQMQRLQRRGRPRQIGLQVLKASSPRQRKILRLVRQSYPVGRLRAVVAFQRKPFACGTRSIVTSSRPSRAWCVAARHPKPIAFASLSPVLSAERSATNIPSRSADSTTAICTATAMKPLGGPGSTSTRYRLRLTSGGDRIPSSQEVRTMGL